MAATSSRVNDSHMDSLGDHEQGRDQLIEKWQDYADGKPGSLMTFEYKRGEMKSRSLTPPASQSAKESSELVRLIPHSTFPCPRPAAGQVGAFAGFDRPCSARERIAADRGVAFFIQRVVRQIVLFHVAVDSARAPIQERRNRVAVVIFRPALRNARPSSLIGLVPADPAARHGGQFFSWPGSSVLFLFAGAAGIPIGAKGRILFAGGVESGDRIMAKMQYVDPDVGVSRAACGDAPCAAKFSWEKDTRCSAA